LHAAVAEPMPAMPRRRRRLQMGMLFMLPAFLILLVFFLGPAVYAVYVGFTNMSLKGTGAASPSWVGLDNLHQILGDHQFFDSLRISLWYLVGSALIGQAVLGMLLALLMKNRRPLFKTVLGGIIVACWVIPDVVAGYLWFAFLHADLMGLGTGSGLFNSIVGVFGVPQRAWLQDFPLASIIVANTWRGTAFSMLLYSSALEGIAPELLEAASIDGAGLWVRVRKIILPLLKGTIATDLLLITLATLSDFTLVMVLTGGGPGFDTQLLTIYMYQHAFKFYELGYGTAIALLIILAGAILSLLYIRVLRVEI
jgi:multiple sugar transport system permease protein